jgi:hypothetical protein
VPQGDPRSVIGRVEVDDASVRIVGDNAPLEQAIAGHTTANVRPTGPLVFADL